MSPETHFCGGYFKSGKLRISGNLYMYTSITNWHEQSRNSTPMGETNKSQILYFPPLGETNKSQISYSPPSGESNKLLILYSPPLGKALKFSFNASPQQGRLWNFRF